MSRYRSPSLKKKHLIDIYDTLYILMGRHVSSYLCNLDVYSSDSVYTMTEYFSRDYLVVGRIPVVPTERLWHGNCMILVEGREPRLGMTDMNIHVYSLLTSLVQWIIYHPIFVCSKTFYCDILLQGQILVRT